MAKDRLKLHELLISILNNNNVYFQPPASIELKYPCIIYKLDGLSDFHANDKRYLISKRYLVTVVDKNPDTKIHEKILELPHTSLNTSFTKDNLNHYICSLHW